MTQRASRLFCAPAGARSAIGALALLASAGHAPAQESGDGDAQDRRPRAAQRIVRHFDFEERQTNALDLPAGWVRAQDDPLVPRIRPGFPIWNLGRLDYTVSANGEGSARLEATGQSASLRLKAGVIPIFPKGEYRIDAVVRCERVVHARPRLVVRALDRSGNPIIESERTHLLETPSGGWRDLSVTLPGVFENAAYLQIDLELVQPLQYARGGDPEHQVWPEDFDAVAWFDDVIVSQVPQLHVRTNSPLNVVTETEGVRLAVELRDLAAEDLTIVSRVFDARRALVASDARQMRSGNASWEWAPDGLELGWYRAVVDVIADDLVIASQTRDFVLVGDQGASERAYRTGPEFQGQSTHASTIARSETGVQLSRLPRADPDAFAQAMARLGVRHVQLPVWEPGLDADQLGEHIDRLRALIMALQGEWVQTHLSLPVAPSVLADELGLPADHVFDVLAADAGSWEPYLLDALDRLGTSVPVWQVGVAGRAQIDPDRGGTSQVRAIRDQLSVLIPGVDLRSGWPAHLGPQAAAGLGFDGVSVLLPGWTSGGDTDLFTEGWHEGEVEPVFVLEPLSPDLHTEREIAAELARRAVRLWESVSPTEVPLAAALLDPWRIDPAALALGRPTNDAKVELAVWHVIADKLPGRRFAANWNLGNGMHCAVFEPVEPDRGGMLVAWQTHASSDASVLRASLGIEPVTLTDVMGNLSTVEPTPAAGGERTEHVIQLTGEPVFVEGIDTELVLFLGSLKLDPGEIQALAGEQAHEVVAHNPWDVPVSGQIFIVDPGGFNEETQRRDRSWEITPRAIAFDIPPGETARLPIVVSISRAIEAGMQRFVFDVELTASQDYGWVRAHSQTEIAWDAITLDVTYRPPSGGPDSDIVVEATVTNTSETPRSFEAFAFAPGQPRARASIGTLKPGQSVVRYFPFPKAAGALAGQRVLVSIAEPDGPGRLTKGVEILGH